MAMPARRFFALIEAARELKSIDRIVEADIGAIPIYTAEYHKKLVNVFQGRVSSTQSEEPTRQLEGVEAQNNLISFFSRGRR